MTTSRLLKFYDNTNNIQSSNENLFEFSLSRNCKVIKTKQDDCPTETTIEEQSCKEEDASNLTLNRKIEVEQSIPKVDLDSILEKCELLRVVTFDVEIPNTPTETQKKHKISFSDLDATVLKILKDARDLISFEKVKSNFGLANYNLETLKINFYSPTDLDQIHILGSVDISESFTEIENKIPIIYINEDTLEIEQNL